MVPSRAGQRAVSVAPAAGSPGPVVAADIYAGETYDATKERPGWSAPGFDASGWAPAAAAPAPSDHVAVSSRAPMPPVRVPGLAASGAVALAERIGLRLPISQAEVHSVRLHWTYKSDRAVAERHGVRKYGFHGTSHEFVARGAADLLGRPLRADLRERILARSGAATLRAYEEGAPVTMDYRPDRLNIVTEAGTNDVLELKCG